MCTQIKKLKIWIRSVDCICVIILVVIFATCYIGETEWRVHKNFLYYFLQCMWICYSLKIKNSRKKSRNITHPPLHLHENSCYYPENSLLIPQCIRLSRDWIRPSLFKLILYSILIIYSCIVWLIYLLDLIVDEDNFKMTLRRQRIHLNISWPI